jgi:putative phosphoesterase
MIFCGDIFGYYYGQQKIIEELFRIPRLHWILGNHDAYYIDLIQGKRVLSELVKRYGSSYSDSYDSFSMLNFFKTISSRKDIIINDNRFCIVHGTPDDSLEGRLYPKDVTEQTEYNDIDVLIMGHTHFRLVRQCGKTLLINPGSLGQPRDEFPSGFAILTLPEKKVEFIDIVYNRLALKHEILQRDPGNEKLVSILYRAKGVHDD